ncbi:uncharacterized protein LOC141816078 [Curcuma longa]|uniref:uncharacterized protein LOC141816078 n=1 Tax=Curcuma longa TaxID=136217 RepID=UPI003D9F1A42
MNPGEAEGSVSLFSTEYSDKQGVARESLVGSSTSHAQLSNDPNNDLQVDGIAKHLTEKLSASLESICAKEELVKQHAKVAEEALLGWEKSKKEVISIKQQLKDAIQKNTSLEERLGHVDDALKECVRQLRQSREEQEERIQEVIIKKASEWEFQKSRLETCLTELQAQLEAKTKTDSLLIHELCLKIEMLENENASLKCELVSLNEDFHTRTLDMELSIRAAETASKQHLESIKKVRKLEAECRSLRARTPKSSLLNDSRPICNSLYGESLTDSQSDSAEKLFSLDNELSIPDSWAPTLITELDQFRNEMQTIKNINSPVEIDLMDDFIEMERFAALTEADYGSSSLEHEADMDLENLRQMPSSDVQGMFQKIAMLEEKIEKMTAEKEVLETTLAEANSQLEISRNQFVVVENELAELHGQLSLISGEKNTLEIKLEILEANRKSMKFEHEAAYKEIMNLKHRIELLEGEVEVEEPLIAKLTSRCQNVEPVDLEQKENELENKYAYWESTKSEEKINLLEEDEEKRILNGSACIYLSMDTFEPKKKELNCLVESEAFEPPKLHEKFDPTERKSEVFGAQFAASRPITKVINAMLDLPYGEVKEDTSLSGDCESDADLLEAKKIELIVQLELEHMEVQTLQEKVHILEKQMENEKELAGDFESRCRTMEDELSRKRQDDLQQFANSNEPVKIGQENEIAQASGRLAECQKTTAALNLQLKSLATLEDFLSEEKAPESSGEVMGQLEGEPDILEFTSSLEKIGGQSVLCSSTQLDNLTEKQLLYIPR